MSQEDPYVLLFSGVLLGIIGAYANVQQYQDREANSWTDILTLGFKTLKGFCNGMAMPFIFTLCVGFKTVFNYPCIQPV